MKRVGGKKEPTPAKKEREEDSILRKKEKAGQCQNETSFFQ